MHTQLQLFITTLLLFSLLLQSCGNPNMKMVEPLDTAVESKPNRPEQDIPQQTTDLGYVALEDGTPKAEKATEASSTSTGFGTLAEQVGIPSQFLPPPDMPKPESSSQQKELSPKANHHLSRLVSHRRVQQQTRIDRWALFEVPFEQLDSDLDQLLDETPTCFPALH